jgi:hypothetical protein
MRVIAAWISALLLLPLTSFAQNQSSAKTTHQPAASKQKARPLYAIGGLMNGTTITAEANGRTFTYRVTGASVVDGRLQFEGVINSSAAKVPATLMATNARSANPWPSAATSTTTRRDAKPKQTVPGEKPPVGEVNEQTQSLYSAVEAGSGCELIYLKLKTPLQPQPLQLGVTLAHQDNTLGNEINQAVCRVTRALERKQDTAAALAQLNRLLAQGK